MSERLLIKNPEAWFTPTSTCVAGSQLTEFMRYCELGTGRVFADYWAFDRFSVEEFPEFWRLFLGWSRIPYIGKIDPVCVGQSCEQARFFTGVRVSYPEALLGDDPRAPAITACHYGKEDERVSRAELRSRFAALAASLERLGVSAGDRVVAIGRNNLEVVVAALAASAIGAIFSSCSPDMGAFAILARFQPLRPIVLLANLRDEPWDLGVPVSARVAEVLAGLTSLRAIIALDDGAAPHGLAAPLHRYRDLVNGGADPEVAWQAYGFNQPLFIMFSSGTTGKPKCIVHGAGGTLLEHVKEHRLHCDLRPGDKLFYQTTCGWMMWNWQLSALASGVELIVYDGPIEGPETLWRLVSDQRVTVFGSSAAFLQFCQASGFAPSRACDLSALRGVLSTGSILYPAQYDWVRDAVKSLPLQSISGGTDILGCFVLGNPNLPIHRGQAQCRSLGLDVRSLVGELICANPFPSCPLGFYDDPDGRRFHEAYFGQNPGVWTHGDLIEATPQDGWILHGRSDGMINVRGIRVGPAEIYAALQGVGEIQEAMAVEQRAPDEIGGTRLVLLVVLRKGASLTSDLVKRIRAELGSRGSPAFVPAVIADVAALPITYSGKRSEAAARDAVNGDPVRNREALQNPDSLHSIAARMATIQPAPPCRPEGDVEGAASGDRLKRDLQQIFEQILRIAPIGWSDDLLELGADSLTVLNLSLAAERRLERKDFSLREFFAARTIDRLAEDSLIDRTTDGLREVSFAAAGGRVRCREIDVADFDSIFDLLTAGFPERPRDFWVKALKLLSYRGVPEGFPRYGYMLESGTSAVGVILLIFSHAPGSGAVRCNGSSWYVAPAFRTFASLLLVRILKHRMTHTDLWPALHTLPIIEALGYRRFCDGVFAAIPALAAGTYQTKTKITRVVEAMRPDIFVPASEQLLLDHESFGCLSLWVETRDGAYPFIFRRRLVKQFPLAPSAQLIYCASVDDLVRLAGPIGRWLALRGMPFMIIPANGPIPGLVGKYFGDKPMYYHGPERPRLGDLAYTEVAMFGR